MTPWAIDQLDRIAGTDDLHVSPFRDDAKTYGTPRSATVEVTPRDMNSNKEIDECHTSL